jgi:hypothetical protein
MDIYLINQKLADTYGTDWLKQPLYRIIWSADQIEKRLGTFNDYIPGTNVFIRKVTEVRECRKYPGFDPQWCLEKLFFNQHNDEILDNDTLNPSTCTYEPLWMFGFENGRAKRPVWLAVQFLINKVNNPKPLTPSELNDEELKRALEEEKVINDLLAANVKNDVLHSSVKDGDTIMMNDAYRRKPNGGV